MLYFGRVSGGDCREMAAPSPTVDLSIESRLLLIRHLVPFHLAVLLIKFRVGSIKI